MKRKKFKKEYLLIVLAVAVLIPCICLIPSKTAEAGSQTFHVPTVVYATPINFTNGSFETPTVTTVRPEDGAMFYCFPMASVPGWSTVPVDYATYGGNSEYYKIELQVVNTGNNGFATEEADGDQYAELNAVVEGRLYQNVSTTPGTRIYWQFAHRAIGAFNIYTNPGNDQMNFYLRAAGSPATAPTSSELICTANDDSTQWHYYRGTYTVPAGQTETEFAFASVSSWAGVLANGNFLDDITLQTGASLLLTSAIYTHVAGENGSVALLGEVVTINQTTQNVGETDASRCVWRDIFSDGLDYIVGSVKISGTSYETATYAGDLATYNATTDNLRINIGDGATVGLANTNGGVIEGSINDDTSPYAYYGAKFFVQLQAEVVGPIGSVVKNQANITYNDSGWESYNSKDFVNYTYVNGQTLDSSDETTYVNQFTIVDRSVHGTVWYDADADGMIDSSETLASGLTVGLYSNTDTTYTTPANDVNGDALVTTTDANGDYSFIALPEGTYQVVLTLPDGYKVTLKTTSTDNDAVENGDYATVTDITLTQTLSTTNVSDTITDVDIGLYPNRWFMGTVWSDVDADGLIDGGETRFSGQTVGLYLSTDTSYTTPINDIYGNPLVTTTSSGGSYNFTAIPAGIYKVVTTTPDGYVVTVLANDNDAVSDGTYAVINNIDMTDPQPPTGVGTVYDGYDIGFIGPHSFTLEKTVGGSEVDMEKDFLFTITLNGLTGSYSYTGISTVSGVSAPADGTLASGSSITLRHGQGIVIADLPHGTKITVVESDNAGYLVATETEFASGLGKSGQGGSLSLTLNSDATTVYTNISQKISGRVWYDESLEGTIDTTEERYAGATVTLYDNSDTTYTTPATDVNGDPLVTTTDTNGEYTFNGVPSGTYQAVVTIPEGYLVTVLANDNDAVASGIYAIISNIDLTSGASVEDEDFGFYETHSFTLKKKVKGDLADKDKEFLFTITLDGLSGSYAYTGISTVLGVDAPADGTLVSGSSITLKHGQGIVFDSLPAGTKITIVESDNAGYTVSSETEFASGLGKAGQGGSLSVTLNSDATTVYTNALGSVTPTGVIMDNLPYIVMAILAGGALLLGLQLKRGKRATSQKQQKPARKAGGYRGL